MTTARTATLALLGGLLFGGSAAAETPPAQLQPPVLEKLVPPRVPPGTRFTAEEVQVLAEIQVDAQGQVTEVKILRGAGAPFDEAALQAARLFRFRPARMGSGQAVPVTIQFTLRIRRPPSPTTTGRTIAPVAATRPARPVDFSGQLLERGSRKPLVGVELRALSPSGKVLASSVTGSDGRFRVKVAATRFEIRGQATGHQPLAAMVEARPGELREERFFLEAQDSGFETLVQSDRVKREISRQVLPKELVEKVPGTANDTLKVVQILPGVSRSAFDAGLLILRGSSPGDSSVLLEGQKIPLLFHFGGLRSSVGSYFLDSVNFVPGSFAADFGRAMGGIIDVKLRDPARDAFRGQIDINLYDASLALEGPLSKSWSVGGSFRRSYIDSILPAVLPDDAPLSFSTAPRFYDYQLLATWSPSPRRRLRLIGYGAMDRVVVLFDRPQNDPTIRGTVDARILFHNFYAGYTERFSDRLSQESSLQIGHQQFKTQLGPEIFFNLDVTSFSFRTAWSFEATRWLTVRTGLDLLVERAGIAVNSPLRPVEGESLAPTATRELFAAETVQNLYAPAFFVEGTFRPAPPLTIIGSLRVDWYRAIRRWTLDPRLTVRYEIGPSTVLKAAFGSYQQPPTPDQTTELTGNPDLSALTSLHLSGGLEQRLWGALQLEITGFHKWLDRQVTRNPIFFYDPRARAYLNGGTGRIYGLELLLRARWGERFQAWVAYTFQRSFRQDGPGASERPFDFDQPHLLTLVGSYRFSRGWSAGLRFRVVSGSPSTPVTGSVLDAGSGVYVPLFGATNSARQATFHQLDLRVDKTWTFRLWKLSAFLDIQNVYNQRNQEGRSYSFDYRESRQVAGLPILPILGLRGEW